MLYNASVEMYLEEVWETTSAKDLHLHAEQEGTRFLFPDQDLWNLVVFIFPEFIQLQDWFIEVKEWTREKSIIDKTS